MGDRPHDLIDPAVDVVIELLAAAVGVDHGRDALAHPLRHVDVGDVRLGPPPVRAREGPVVLEAVHDAGLAGEGPRVPGGERQAEDEEPLGQPVELRGRGDRGGEVLAAADQLGSRRVLLGDLGAGGAADVGADHVGHQGEFRRPLGFVVRTDHGIDAFGRAGALGHGVDRGLDRGGGPFGRFPAVGRCRFRIAAGLNGIERRGVHRRPLHHRLGRRDLHQVVIEPPEPQHEADHDHGDPLDQEAGLEPGSDAHGGPPVRGDPRGGAGKRGAIIRTTTSRGGIGLRGRRLRSIRAEPRGTRAAAVTTRSIRRVRVRKRRRGPGEDSGSPPPSPDGTMADEAGSRPRGSPREPIAAGMPPIRPGGRAPHWSH